MTPAERALLARASAMMPAVAASLRWRGFKQTSLWLARAPQPETLPPAALSADQISAVVDIVARRHPAYKATCLPQSLLLWHYLRGHGYPAELRIGVGKPQGVFAAHAWVELDGRVLNDRPDVGERYAVVDLPAALL